MLKSASECINSPLEGTPWNTTAQVPWADSCLQHWQRVSRGIRDSLLNDPPNSFLQGVQMVWRRFREVISTAQHFCSSFVTPRAGTLGNGMRQKLWLLVTGLSALRLLEAAQDAGSVARWEAAPCLLKPFQVSFTTFQWNRWLWWTGVERCCGLFQLFFSPWEWVGRLFNKYDIYDFYFVAKNQARGLSRNAQIGWQPTSILIGVGVMGRPSQVKVNCSWS